MVSTDDVDRPAAVLLVLAVVLVVGAPTVSAVAAPDRTMGQPGEPVLVGAFGAADDGAVTQLDASGDVVWQHDGAVSYASVQRVDETNVLAGVQYRASEQERCGQFNAPCARTGTVLINHDENGTTAEQRWTFPTAFGRNSEVHDAEGLPNGDTVVVDMDRERVVRVNGTTGEIEWQWNASEHYDEPDDPLRSDWLHMNDVDRIGDGRYLVSVRNANQLVIVEEGAGVVEVINKDRSHDVLHQQHNPQWLGDGAVLVADSENNRIAELHRQPDDTWSVEWQISAAGGQVFDWPRDADRLPNGNTLIVDTRNARILEVTPAGDVVWSRVAPVRQPYDADLGDGREPAAGAVAAHGTGDVTNRVEQPFHSVALFNSAILATIGLPWWWTSWDMLFVLTGLVLGSLGLTRTLLGDENGDHTPLRERGRQAREWLSSDRDPTEDPDGAAGRILLVIVGALLIQAAFRLWAILKPLEIVGAVAVIAVGAAAWQTLVFAATDLDLSEHGHTISYAILAILGLAVFVSVTAANLFKAFPTDSLLFTAYSADLALQGTNPFASSMEGAFGWSGSTLRYATPTIDGGIVLDYSYPAGAFLAFVPAVATPVPARALAVVGAVGLGGVVSRAAPAELALAGPAALMASRNLVITAAGGVWDVMWAVPFAIALLAVERGRHATGGVALGVACAIKQIPWLAAPFIVVRQWRLGNRRGAVVGSAVAVGVFGAINAPWIVADPAAWATSVIAPLGTGSPLVHQGIGLTILTFTGVFALPVWWHALAVAVFATVGLVATVLYPERVGYAVWLAPPALLWAHYRSLTSYFTVFVPLAVVAVLATQGRVRPAAIPAIWSRVFGTRTPGETREDPVVSDD